MRNAADRNNELVHDQFLIRARGVGIRNGKGLRAGFDLADFYAGVNDQPLLRKSLVRFLGHLLVSNGQKVGHGFQDGDLGTQATPYAAKLQADDTGPDHTQGLGHRGKAQGTIVGQHLGLVEWEARQSAWSGARGDNDMLGNEIFVSFASNLDGPAAVHMSHEGTRAMKESNLVLLEQIQDAVVVLLDHRGLATDQGVELQAHALQFDAVIGKVMVSLFEVLGRLKQCLGRNAAHVGAGASWCGLAVSGAPCVYSGHRHAQLGCTDGSNVSARTGADNDYVELFSHIFSRS